MTSQLPPLRFSRHARNRMRLWKIAEADVRMALEKPEDVTPSYRGRKNAWKQFGKSWLRVTYAEEAKATVVVTVTPMDRKPGRRGR